MRIFLFAGIAFFISVFLVYNNLTSPTDLAAEVQDSQQATGEADSQDSIKASARKTFMRGKLQSNQMIVEGLATKNFEMIAAGATSVTLLVKGQHWFVLDTAEYKRFSEDMELAATQLHAAAKAQNMEGAALRYFDLTLNCIDCHRYVEQRKY
jgi:hypothetical protein